MCHPWVVGSPWLAWLVTYRARLGDAGAARRAAEAAAHTYNVKEAKDHHVFAIVLSSTPLASGEWDTILADYDREVW